MPHALAPVARFVGHLCRLGLAFIFLSAGGLKALDPNGFAHEVAQYGLLQGGLATAFAYVMIPVEVALGVALLLNFRTVRSLSAAIVLLLMFVGAIGFAIVTDRPVEDCGCFGRYTPRTLQQSLVEDLGFLAAGLFGLSVLRGARTEREVPRTGRWKGPVVAAVALLSGVFTVASPRLPLDDVATILRPGVSWDGLGIALAEADLGEGRWLVALLALDQAPSAAAVEELNAMAGDAPYRIVGLYAEDDAVYNEFFWTKGPAFPLYHIAPSDMKQLQRRLPRFAAVSGGEVRETWTGVPTEEQVERALR